jgi:hypothetical protein
MIVSRHHEVRVRPMWEANKGSGVARG